MVLLICFLGFLYFFRRRHSKQIDKSCSSSCQPVSVYDERGDEPRELGVGAVVSEEAADAGRMSRLVGFFCAGVVCAN